MSKSVFSLTSLQQDSVDLPSVTQLQSMDRLPSLQDLQTDRPGLPSLHLFQSLQDLERSASVHNTNKLVGRARARQQQFWLRKYQSVDTCLPSSDKE